MANLVLIISIVIILLVRYTISDENNGDSDIVALKPVIKVRNASQADATENKCYVFDFLGLVQRYGYPAEEHVTTTEDGYNLRLHRIPGSQRSPPAFGKPVVLIQHGIMGSSDSWVVIGPSNGLPFALADAGYDVWVGNVRGNTYSRSHQTLKPSDRKFWDFSFHEMGTHDLPAMIDYILLNTKQTSLHYVGHSMGTTVSYILLSERPEYNKKMNLVVSLAPVAFWKHIRPPFERLVKRIYPAIEKILHDINVYEVFPQSRELPEWSKLFCHGPANPCKAIVKTIAGRDTTLLNSTMLPYIFEYFPAGCSTKTLRHFWQNMSSRTFQQYDEGLKENLKKYGQLTPKLYEVRKVTAPIALIYGPNDPISTRADSKALSALLPNVITMEPVGYSKFNHVDFQWASRAKELVNDRVIDLMKRYDRRGTSE